mmetsp:Transcript_37504/g.58583  ORF Transcript_37504/g.58583 Transcript_37504/m.58583 type:complete len:183 (-) Transcript_37504:630-1178(-)|eukprot:CAMPEP_0184330536 /NCGR_PEP_ID=MMETSP1049-20130417/144737_1 /TAXON_ID=77928 /ORGANISM="Proteomonas sulcata, Strain CCMP704" /LENGTH=182 /DNA_ID=CAMNT_0026652981 /DNA_START=147 /DNA_END=695 /DNA_ORIENTATION=+
MMNRVILFSFLLSCWCLGLAEAFSQAAPKVFGTSTPQLRLTSGRVSNSQTLRTPALSLKAQAELDDKTAGGLGAVGLFTSAVMLYSEYTLKTTGCGLPAGPGGAVGAIEGISYLAVLGLVGYSVFTKVKTGKGLPAGPGGLLGAAEGVAYLAVLAGVVVLGFQVLDYGYVPNAVPTEGGKCS